MVSIGNIHLSNPLILAPLAGYGDLAFRLLCREHGAGLCVSEMVSCHGLVYQQQRTIRMLDSCPSEKPVSFQLFGADPVIMGEAAALLTAFNPDIIDINMGCPVRKVTKRGAGAALMCDIKRAEQIVREVISNTTCPVTIKIRSGPDSKTTNAPEFARMAESNGIAAITVHGRNWKQAFSGSSDWDIVSQVKKTVTIPVIGNGDIANYGEAQTRLATSGCDAVMIGRAALGNPWVFSAAGKPRDSSEIIRGARRHMELYELSCGDEQPRLAPIKNHLGRYFKGIPQSSLIRQNICQINDWESLKILLQSMA
jgi:tRNA-dihydrouridine synthase B